MPRRSSGLLLCEWGEILVGMKGCPTEIGGGGIQSLARKGAHIYNMY